jgi:(1->4)-alpha-D-glucan 1-alpha-D-glucosylmutase
MPMKDDTFRWICDLAGIDFVAPVGDEAAPLPGEAERQTLLAAWGLVAPEGGSTGQVLEGLLRAHWHRLLPPALVLGEDAAPLAVPVRLPGRRLAEPLHWQLVEESGARREGTVQPGALEALDTAQLEGERYTALRLTLAFQLPAGYHRLTVGCGDDPALSPSGECLLIVAPATCYISPGLLRKGRIWGLGCALENVRSRRNWGCGDLTDLQALLGWAAESGAGTVAVSSLLSRRLAEDGRSPQALPSDRCFPDPIFLDLEAVADFHESGEARALVALPAFQVRLAQLREAREVAWPEVTALKTEVAEVLWRHFQLNHLNPETERGWGYRRFQEQGGERLYAFALYEALRGHLRTVAAAAAAPEARAEPWCDRTSPAVAAFAASQRERIEFHQYLQWQLELQLAAAGQRSMELGLKVGMTLTLPAGVDPEGFAVWEQPALFGVPLQLCHCPGEADCFPYGPPLLASRLAAAAYAPFIAMLRANMHSAGALRFNAIDLLERQCWRFDDAGDGPSVGVAPAGDDLLAIIALESQRNRCLVIGEHHGPLSPDFAAALERRGILVSRPGAFARDPGGEWLAPAGYPQQAVVTPSRYELCTLDGFWRGSDIALLASRCPGFDDRNREAAIVARASDRARLLVALRHEGLLPPDHDLDPAGIPDLPPALIRAVYAFLARTPARILLVQVPDLIALSSLEKMTPPLPPAVVRPRLAVELEILAEDEGLRRLFREYCLERSVGVVRPSVPLADRRRHPGQALPRAFYRIQFNRDCTFRATAAHLPYLRDLGISHCYASPYLQARPGSTHGYDIIDHSRLNPEIGSREDYEAFVAALDHNGLAQILDMVPNHMGVGTDNRWWLDVLENGQASAYAAFFDINWQSQEEELKNRILLPVLGDYFGRVLEEGGLRLVFLPDHGSFEIAYYEHRFPVAPRSYPLVVGHDLPRLETRLGSRHEGFLELQNLVTSFAALPTREEPDPDQVEMRNRNKEVLKRLLARLCREVHEVAVFIEENVLLFNGEPGRPDSFNLLEQLLAQQAYRLAFWRVASDEINYRRFFDINDLAGLRMDRREVFDRTHRLVLDLIATGRIDGLRIDHPDGLYNPAHYFRTLQAAVSGVAAEPLSPPAGLSLRKRTAPPLYVVVEKILADFEQLPANWLVHGTTGYDFSSLVNGIFVDRAAEPEMTAIYHRFIGREIDFAELAHDCRRLIIRTAMAGESNVLSNQLHRLAKRNRYTQDYTLNGLREALTEIVACFPVYRTYCTSDRLDGVDRRHVEEAVKRAKARWQVEDTSIYDFIRSVLLLEATSPSGSPQDTAVVDFVKKFQQYTGPVMAKGLEDTAFYIYHRLVSLNEVGDDPSRFGVTVERFHAGNRARAERWPQAMLTTSTHDSKRSEDVRARINVLAEMPGQWREAVERWHEMNRGGKTAVGRDWAPSTNDEYALYQNLLGVWPLEPMTGEERAGFCARFTAYMLKAAREAKVHTSWLNQNQVYEQALTDFIARLLVGEDHPFVVDFIAFQHRIARFGMVNSLAQLLLKLTAPGIPDTYQGNETWQFCLVDPDNRRPVDFAARREMLAGLQRLVEDDSAPLASRLQELLRHGADGRIKMYVLWRTLTLRREHPAIFMHGAYQPLHAVGAARGHLCAFARIDGDRVVIAAVPRLVARLLHGNADRLPLGPEVWGRTALHLPARFKGCRLTNIMSGEDSVVGAGDGRGLAAAELFRHFPVALLAGPRDLAPER